MHHIWLGESQHHEKHDQSQEQTKEPTPLTQRGEAEDVDGFEEIGGNDIAAGPSVHSHILVGHTENTIVVIEVFRRKQHGQQLGRQHHHKDEDEGRVFVAVLPPTALVCQFKFIAHESESPQTRAGLANASR